MNYMGIDHHKQYSHLTLLDNEGKQVKSSRVWNTEREVRGFLEGKEGETRAVIEAVHPACVKDYDVRLFYQRRARRKAANIAKAATARRLITIIYRVLREQREYILYKR
jgi:hypothetical protein